MTTEAQTDIGAFGSTNVTKVLLEEKNELERALFSIQEALQTSTSEKEQIHKLYTDFKSHFETIQKQCGNYQRRLVEEMGNRKSLED